MNILAIGAHWDDIELGCSLTLKRLSESGHTVFCIVMCKAHYVAGNHHGPTEEQAKENGLKSFEYFSGNYLFTEKHENGKLAYSQEAMKMLESWAAELEINAVFCHWFGDVNTDHQATWQIARTAFRRIDNFLMYQSNTYCDHVNHFTPNYFQCFTEKEYELKSKILSRQSGEWAYRKERWEREIFGREKFWGFLCERDYAEGFMASKLINNFL